MSDTVIVLMSTYNGEKFLREQIESILNQKDVLVKIIVRDDGSTDNTLSILDEYKSRGVQWFKGCNIGPAKSFMELIYNAPEAEYYALSDQDDIWRSDKLCRAVSLIKGKNRNDKDRILYASNQNIVDGDGKFRSVRFSKDMSDEDVFDVLLNGHLSGCTMVFNRKFKEAISSKDHRPDNDVFKYVMHDGWLHVSICCNGNFIYDSVPTMDFRRHGKNTTTAMNYNLFEKIRRSFRFLFSGKKCTYKIWAKEILRIYGNDLTKSEIMHLQKFSNYDGTLKRKVDLIRDKFIRRKFPYNSLLYYSMVILGRIE